MPVSEFMRLLKQHDAEWLEKTKPINKRVLEDALVATALVMLILVLFALDVCLGK